MFAYVGGYTTQDRDGRGDGIHVYHVADDAAWTHVQHVAGEENPSMFTVRPDGRLLYAVHGGREFVSAFGIDPATGALRLLNRQRCAGSNPVDVALSADNRFLAVANYATSSVASLSLHEDGSLDDVTQVFFMPGTPGPDPVQQSASHPHGVIFDATGRFLVAPDKGYDRTFIFSFEDGYIDLLQALRARPGSAPRHCIFHPTLPVLYVNNELDSTVTVYRWDHEQAEQLDIVGTLPPGWDGSNTTAEIGVAPDGRFLYVSNRGHDSIAIFAVSDSGRLSPAGHVPSGGKRPRFFTLDPAGAFLYAANQESDNIVAFAVDRTSGTLTPTGHEVRVGSPSAISFVT
jgi:6-phosphogluconolactonase